MMVKHFSQFIANHPKIILIVAVLLLIPSIFGAVSTKINYDILSYLPGELDSVKGEKILDEVFGSAGSALLIVENMPSKDVLLLKEKITCINGVKNVVWVDSFTDISIPNEILPDILSRIFYSKNGDSTLLMIQFDGLSASESTMNAVNSIKTLMNKQCFLSGMSVLMSDTQKIVECEAPIYIAVAAVVAFAALVITMGSFSLPIIISVSLALAVIYNFGTNFFGEISYITQSIAAILQIGVTMDFSVFLSDRYTEELRNGKDKKTAMSDAISKTFFSLSGSALTTFFGFLAMCFMSFSLGPDIGIVMSKGVILGLFCALLILPSMLLLLYNPSQIHERKNFVPNLGKLSFFALKRRKFSAVIFVILMICSYFIKNNVDIYYDFIKALPQDMTSVESVLKLKEDFEMATTHFALFDDTLDSYSASKMAEEFGNAEGVTSVLSLNTFVGPAIPDDIIPEAITEMCRKGGYELMMINSSYMSSTDEANLQTEMLNRIIKKYDNKGFITGEASLSKDLAEVTDRDFSVTRILSIVAVYAVIAVLFKSLVVPAVLVSTIELAVFLNEAIPFFFGEEIPFIAPTIISCVQLGATVDYAILMTSRFKEEIRKGKTKFRAAKEAAILSGKSIFQSSLVLFGATFGVYCVSNVMLIKSICMMLARGAVISAVVIMIFLPALLYLTEPSLKRKKRGENNDS